VVFSLGLKNLLRNAKNTLILLFVIAVITFLFFIGNTIIAESHRGLRRTYIRNYTGDIVILQQSDVSMSIFGANTPSIGEFFVIPTLKQYDELVSILTGIEEVKAFTSQLTGTAAMDIHGRRYPVPLFGIDPETYFDVFPGIILHRGKFLEPGERGVMITTNRAARIERETGKELSLGDEIMFSTVGPTGFKIRAVPLRGIYSYQSSGEITDEIVLVDPQTLRGLNSIFIASGSDYAPPKEAVDLLSGEMEDLFGEEGSAEDSVAGDLSADGGLSLESLTDRLREEDTSGGRRGGDIGRGGWNFLLLRLDEGARTRAVLTRLNGLLKHYSAEAVDWRQAAGTSAVLVQLLQVLYNGGFLLVGIAGTIGIVNIMLIAVFRRTREIGTLRAIGATDRYIWGLLYFEELTVSLLAGLFGIVLGVAAVAVINRIGITITNDLIASLLGQRLLQIGIRPWVVVGSLCIALVFGFLASLYPVRKALAIQPVIAMEEG
jgi:putative ABC transport system permease protein